MNEQEKMANKTRYITILKKVKREGIDDLIGWLENTDFFEAPASTRFHEPYPGGLCEHSLAVYDNTVKLNKVYKVMTEEQIAICALLHDACKCQFYKVYMKNQKNDTTGQWEKVQAYMVEDAFPMGHGEKSMFLVSQFIKLKPSEAMAIRWHMGGFDKSVVGGDYSCGQAYEKYPMAALIHLADMAATYLSGKE